MSRCLVATNLCTIWKRWMDLPPMLLITICWFSSVLRAQFLGDLRLAYLSNLLFGCKVSEKSSTKAIFACFLEFINSTEMKDAVFIRIFQVCFGLHYPPSPFFLVPSQFVNSAASAIVHATFSILCQNAFRFVPKRLPFCIKTPAVLCQNAYRFHTKRILRKNAFQHSISSYRVDWLRESGGLVP